LIAKIEIYYPTQNRKYVISNTNIFSFLLDDNEIYANRYLKKHNHCYAECACDSGMSVTMVGYVVSHSA
jgi:hypothetical protein